jgi:hypothetical protein
MKCSGQISAAKDRAPWALLVPGVVVFAALVLFAPRNAWAQDMEDDPMHDASDEEMLTGVPTQPGIQRPTAPGEEALAAELSYATRRCST